MKRSVWAVVLSLFVVGTVSAQSLWIPGGSSTVKPIPYWDLGLYDSNHSHVYRWPMGSDATADRIITWSFGDADRTITVSGNPTLSDWFDQSVKTSATPSFAGVRLPADGAEVNLGATANDYTIKWDGSDAVHTITAGDFAFSGGKVGIGTTTPSTALTVTGTHVTDIGLLHIDNDAGHAFVTVDGSTNGQAGVNFKENGGKRYIMFYDALNNFLSLYDSATSNYRITVQDTSGNVGIGTTAPQSLIDGQGPEGVPGIFTLATKGTTTVDGDVLGRINFNAPLDVAGGDSRLAGAAIWAEADATFSSTVNNTDIVFGTATTSAAVERMRIDSAGKLIMQPTGSGAFVVTVSNGDAVAGSGGFLIRSSQTANAGFRLLPYGDDIYFQNTYSAGGMIFSGLNGADLTGSVIFKGTCKLGLGTAGAPANTHTVVGNASLGDVAVGTNATRTFLLQNGTVPASSPADSVQLYAEDDAGSSELKVRDEATNVTTLSPHNFTLYDPDPSDPFPWSYYSKNDCLGIEQNVDISGLVRAVEELTHKTFIHRRIYTPPYTWDAHQQLNAVAKHRREEIEVTESNATNTVMVEETDKVTVEVAIVDAFEDVEITEQVEDGTKAVFSYTVDDAGEVTITSEDVPIMVARGTGEFQKQLKADVTFNADDGKFYRIETRVVEVPTLAIKPGFRQDQQTGKYYRFKTEAEAIASVRPEDKKQPPKWLKDRLPVSPITPIALVP